jgi:hypothetical protein
MKKEAFKLLVQIASLRGKKTKKREYRERDNWSQVIISRVGLSLGYRPLRRRYNKQEFEEDKNSLHATVVCYGCYS